MLQNLLNSYSDSSSTTSSISSSSSSEEDYINMEVDDHHHSSFFNQHSSCNEFEFQQSFSSSSDRDPHISTTSPADELFYMGKLLPLHLPPRLEMVNKILLHTSSASFNAAAARKGGDSFEEEAFATPLFGTTPTAATPFESCNVSPSGSCGVSSRELTPLEYGDEEDYFVTVLDEKKPWTTKTKMIKQSSSSSSSKIKWTSFIKSLFTKSSGCTNEHSAAADHRQFSKTKPSLNSHCKNSSAPFGQIKYSKDNSLVEDQRGRHHRRSFSGAIKRLSKPKSSTSSTSLSTANNINLLMLKRSIISTSETESPIQAAIAHCKKSQNKGRFCSISDSSRDVFDDQESVGVCRG